jgi:hypothetical protein
MSFGLFTSGWPEVANCADANRSPSAIPPAVGPAAGAVIPVKLFGDAGSTGAD